MKYFFWVVGIFAVFFLWEWLESLVFGPSDWVGFSANDKNSFVKNEFPAYEHEPSDWGRFSADPAYEPEPTGFNIDGTLMLGGRSGFDTSGKPFGSIDS